MMKIVTIMIMKVIHIKVHNFIINYNKDTTNDDDNDNDDDDNVY